MIRYEFADESVTQERLHPIDIYQQEQKLAYTYLIEMDKSWIHMECPVCGSVLEEVLFAKWGYAYLRCQRDWSLSLAPKPSLELRNNYFFNSELALFRASKNYQDQVTRKRRHIWENLIDWIESRVARYLGAGKYSFLAWGPKNVGWLQILESASCLKNLSVMNPLPPINGSLQRTGTASVTCMMDVLQKETKPDLLLKEAYENLTPGGLVLITCRSGTGFDILTLREASDSVFPLDHIFLPSPAGLEKLLLNNGFEVLEMTTPGMLDVPYVESAQDLIPRDQFFQRYFMSIADDHMRDRLQVFLQRNNLSSHLRCVARKS